MAPRGFAPLVLSALALLGALNGVAEEGKAADTVEAVYPGLLTGVLSSATPGDLAAGVLVDMDTRKITQEELDNVLANSPEEMREELARNAVFLVQEMATKTLLLRAAAEAAAAKDKDLEGKSEPEIISDYLQELLADVSVSDAEVREFYEGNRDMFGGAELGDVEETLGQYLLKVKRQEMVDRHIRSLGGKYHVVISASWLKAQAVLARDNPVDKARASGKPTMVDFGAEGCRPCDMMAPILEDLRKKYSGRANIVFVHAGKHRVLSARYGIQAIPVQVFFDKDGREVSRHTGFFPQVEIEKKLVQLGVR